MRREHGHNMVIEWMQFLLGTGLLILGMSVFVLELFGTFKFKYVLNRMHAAAVGDTFGIGLSLLGLMILSGFHFVTLKMGLVIVFLWLASPVSSHLIARLEVTTNEHIDEFCEQEVMENKEEKGCKS